MAEGADSALVPAVPRAAKRAGCPDQPTAVFVTVMPGLAVDLLVVAGMIYDWRTRGRVHRVYWIAGGVTLAVQVLRVPLSQTSAWLTTTHWLLAIAP